MRSHYLRKIGSILGLCAILLTVCAPLISQSLRARESLDVALSFCSVHGVTQGAPAQDDPASSHLQHGDACAYCGFSVHFPALAPAVAEPGLLAAAAWFPPLLRTTAFRPAEFGNWAQPRGPPHPLDLI